MITRIEVASNIKDTRASVRLKKLHALGFKNISDLWITDVYTVDKTLAKDSLKKAASYLANPVTQEFNISSSSEKRKKKKRINKSFSHAIEIGFLPGVTDNISHTAKEIIEDLLKTKFTMEENVYTSQITFIKGDITEDDANQIALSLYNPLIQSSTIRSFSEFAEKRGMGFFIPKVVLNHKVSVTEVDLNVSDDELLKIGKAGIKNPDGSRRGPLALDLVFMKNIQKYFKKLGKNPNDIELESIAQTWSEHCKHTIFNDPLDDLDKGLFKTFIKKATEEIRKKKQSKDFCISVFSDNSGGIAFDDDYIITHKVETHNSPSALDPFGGAVTGIVGVNRDTLGFGLGAKPIANFYGFCFADPRIDSPLYKVADFTQKMLSSQRIMSGVIDGVNNGGNCSGIPTPQGFIYFDERFRGKPLVFVGTIGLIPKVINGRKTHLKKAMRGDYIVMIGGRVGKDGIHGATFSSEAMDSGSPATAVQIGDPITQKKLSDALVLEARERLLYNSITDNGAGGLSCSVAEMAKESGGCLVQLEKVPLKYHGLNPWEIWISESQERMTLAVPKEKWREFKTLMERRGVEASIIGEFTDSGSCVVNFNSEKIMDIDLEFLHNGLPKRLQTSKQPEKKKLAKLPVKKSNLTEEVLQLLSWLNITSYEFISQQYDYIVQGNSVIGPLQGRGRINGDASVIRPVLALKKGVISSQGLYPSYTEIDPYAMACASIDTAVRNIIASGADPEYIAILDNFCWCSPTEPERLWQLKQAAKACYDCALEYNTPFISGKDSMFNDFKGYDENNNPVKISIPPTLLITSLGVVENINEIVTLDVKSEGDLVYILGDTYEEIGGSEYLAMLMSLQKQILYTDSVPKANPRKNMKLYKAFYQCIKQGIIASSIGVGRGGLSVALAKKAMGGMLGMEINLDNIPLNVARDDFLLFSESQGRILLTISQANQEKFENLMKEYSFAKIGIVTKSKEFIIRRSGKIIVKSDINSMLISYRETFKTY